MSGAQPRRPHPYVARVERRVVADAFFLGYARKTGDLDAAADQTCELFGHDARGGLCERCGCRVTAEEARRGRGGRPGATIGRTRPEE